MDVNKFRDAFVEGVYARVSEMTPEERERVKQGKEIVLDFIGAVGAFVDVADEYVNKAIEVVEGLYVDVKDDTVAQPQSTNSAVKPVANPLTLSTIYNYLLKAGDVSLYWETLSYHAYYYDDAAAAGLLNLYNEVLESTQNEVEAISERNQLGLSQVGYDGFKRT